MKWKHIKTNTLAGLEGGLVGFCIVALVLGVNCMGVALHLWSGSLELSAPSHDGVCVSQSIVKGKE